LRRCAPACALTSRAKMCHGLRRSPTAATGTGTAGMGRLARIGLLMATAWALGVPIARAEPGLVADIASYQGADRTQRLVDGAKREKELTLYSSIPTDDIAVLAAAFDKRYGVKVKAWRSDSEGFLQRIVGEARARRFEVDVVAGSSSALEPLYRE